ncbi:MAG: hypothetical protein L7U78_01595 [Schleiferiaceae bacterium]|nr:hypothetical protein [Schleiferiaceae bacterium]
MKNSDVNNNPIQDAGDSLNQVASAISRWLWTSIVAAVIVAFLLYNDALSTDGVVLIEIIYGAIVLALISSVIGGLRKAAVHLKNHN